MEKRDFEVKTEHSQQIRVIIEVLKEVLDDVCLEVCREKKKVQTSSSEEINDKKVSSKKKNQRKQISQSSDTNSSSDSESSVNDIQYWSDGYIGIVATDPTKTIIIKLKLRCDEFTSFYCGVDEKLMGVSLQNLHKLLKSMDKEDMLTLFTKSIDSSRLWIERVNKPREKRTLEHINLIEIGRQTFDTKSIKFDMCVTIQSIEFHKLCKDMSVISQFVHIYATREYVEFTCNGENSGRHITYKNNQSVTREKQGCVNINFDKDSNVKKAEGYFDLKHIILFSKFSQLCQSVRIYLRDDYLLFLKYTVATNSEVIVGLSPKRKDEESTFESAYSNYTGSM